MTDTNYRNEDECVLVTEEADYYRTADGKFYKVLADDWFKYPVTYSAIKMMSLWLKSSEYTEVRNESDN